MKAYSKPKAKAVRLDASPLMEGSEEVEFRFDTSVNDKWNPDDEHNLE